MKALNNLYQMRNEGWDVFEEIRELESLQQELADTNKAYELLFKQYHDHPYASCETCKHYGQFHICEFCKWYMEDKFEKKDKSHEIF